MEQFDKDMKNWLDNHQENIPEIFQWEEIKDGIYKKMDRPKRKPRKRFIWLLLLLPIGFGLYLFARNASDSSTINAIPKVQIAKSNTSIHNINTGVVAQNTPNQLNFKDPLFIGKTTQKRSLPPSESVTSKHLGGSLEKSIVVNMPNKEALSSTTSSQDINSIQTITRKNKTLINQRSSEKYGILSPLPNKFFLKIAFSPDLGIETLHVQNMNKKGVSLKQSVTLLGGTLRALGQFQQTNYRNDYTSWKPGYHAGIQYALQNKKGWGVAAGYNYEMSVQYFELIGMDTIEEEQQITTTIVRNVYNEHVVRTKTGNKVVKVLRDRNYQTYNTFKNHRVNLIGFKQFQLAQKWTLKTGVGISYAFAKKYQGYTTNENLDIIQYDNHENAIFKASSIAGLVTGNIGRKLSDHLTVEAYFSTFKSLTNWSTETDIKLQPTTIHLGLGLKYDF